MAKKKELQSSIVVNPLKDVIVVLAEQEPVEEEKKSSIIIVEQKKVPFVPTQGVVYAVGSNVTQVKKGDVVLFEKYATKPMRVDGIEYHFFTEEQLLAILTRINP